MSERESEYDEQGADPALVWSDAQDDADDADDEALDDHVINVSNDDDESDVPGAIQISEEVVGVIAGMAAAEVEGVAAMSGGFVGGITEMLGKRNLSKGVKVDIRDNNVQLSLYMSVHYGVRIPRVAQTVQEKVKAAVESMTGLNVTRVNIHIQGVTFPGEERALEPR